MRLSDLWGMIRFGIGSVTSKDGQADAIGSTPGPLGSTKGQDQTARYYPWGFDSRSPTGGKRLCIAPGGGSQLVQVGERNDKAPPDYADEGWTTILHNERNDTWVKLRKDGGVQIAGKGALIELKPDGTIQHNGGTLTVNRQGDAVAQGSAMKTWMTAVTTATMVPPLVGTDIGTTGPGSPKVKVP